MTGFAATAKLPVPVASRRVSLPVVIDPIVYSIHQAGSHTWPVEDHSPLLPRSHSQRFTLFTRFDPKGAMGSTSAREIEDILSLHLPARFAPQAPVFMKPPDPKFIH